MPGNSQATVTDVNAVPAPQYFNPVTGVYEYLNGQSGTIYAAPNPIIPYHTSAGTGYEAGHQIKSSAGIFLGLSGTSNVSSAGRWIMIFDTAANPPINGTIPLNQVFVPAATSGTDNNFFISPDRPFNFSNGLYIAASTTGGTLTITVTNDCFFVVEYL